MIEEFVWSDDRQRWLTKLLKDHNVTTAPKEGLLVLVSQHNPVDILDERTTTWRHVGSQFLLGDLDEHIYTGHY